MNAKEYPFTKCLSPVRITNKYTKESMIVGCGKCCACRSSRSASQTLKCKLESMSHKYSYFVTLTYNQDTIPLMYAANKVGYHGTFFEFRDVQTDEYVTSMDYNHTQLNILADKVNLGGYFPYLRKTDLQKFMKRLRKNISHISDERIRYYACGEFGPKHLRPHYHLQLWFSDDKIAENLVEIVSKSWKLGYTDTQKVQSTASQYVAGYINSLGSLPRLYSEGKCKPFSCHSFFLGEKLLKAEKEKVYKTSVKDFVRRSIVNTHVSADFVLWRSVTDYFYPRCREFATSTTAQRKLLYTTYIKYRGRTDFAAKPFVLSDMILKEMFYYEENKELIQEDLLPLVEFFYNFYNLRGRLHFDMDYSLYDDYCKFLVSVRTSIYRDLRISKHFLEFVCNTSHPLEIDTKISMIEHFWSDYELMKLGDWYDQQITFLDDYDLDDITMFYADCDLNTYLSHPSFHDFKSYALTNADNRMKHKRQNDANRIFFREVKL